MIASLTSSVVGTPADISTAVIKTCKEDIDCQGYGVTTGDCHDTDYYCSNSCSYFGDGTANQLKQCEEQPVTTKVGEEVTLYYVLNNIADGDNKVINCDNVNMFTNPYDSLIKGVGVTAGFTEAERNTIQITHLCHKPATGVHTLMTSVKVTVKIDNLLSVSAATGDLYRKMGENINTKLAETTVDAKLASVGKVDSNQVITDKALFAYCPQQTNGVFVPFAADFVNTATVDKMCKPVSCSNGFTFDKLAKTPTCEGPGAFPAADITTCGANEDCDRFGQTGTECESTTYKCKAAAGTCVHFETDTRSLAQCYSTKVPTATQNVTLYYILRNTEMTGHPSKTVNCSEEFTSEYDELIMSNSALGKFTTDEQATVSIVHNCDATNDVHTLRTSIKVAVFIEKLLDANTYAAYSELANNINGALASSTDVKLNAVGGVESVNVGTSESFSGLCPVTGNEEMKVPMAITWNSSTAGDRDCQVVECSAGYDIINESCTATPEPAVSATQIAVTFQATSEIRALGEQRTAITKSVGLGMRGVATCNKICKTSDNTHCWTCPQAATATRVTSSLAVERYTLYLTGTTTTNETSVRVSVTSQLKSLFSTLTVIQFHEDSVTAVFIVSDDGDDSLSSGVVAGIVIGCVVFVTLAVALVYYMCANTEPVSVSNAWRSTTEMGTKSQ